ncbi:hypothetical protein [Novipirellula artificiosorum]|uniref:hypothetical protein n=1 Tax=Novipirellula artificiosorum TaxID=2528016 RepID=UPI0011B3D227|nr:hypothetical protein [Novipirellula artificiosorum]
MTAHFGKWDHRYDEITPAEQGYDFSDGYTGNSTGGAKGSGGPAVQDDPKRIDTITNKALQFIDRSHAANQPSRQRSRVGQYQAEDGSQSAPTQRGPTR